MAPPLSTTKLDAEHQPSVAATAPKTDAPGATTATASSTTTSAPLPNLDLQFVRGVNLGGWLVLERYITPYQFAVTDCHVQGDFCWYPGQASAPPFDAPNYRECDLLQCRPMLTAVDSDSNSDTDNPIQEYDYPVDEYTLAKAFGTDTAAQRATATAWFNTHFDNFMTQQDIQDIAASGLTHVRVPLPHWILGHVEHEQSGAAAPWIVGDRWKYFKRMVGWCREAGLQVWPDIHTAPGSQNGFDNSGHALKAISCQGWSSNPAHVQHSLQVLRNVTAQIVADGMQDVVTGFGLLNEPFKDCQRDVYEAFVEQGLDIVRNTLGEDTAVYVSDMFLAKTFNNGQWWINQVGEDETDSSSKHTHATTAPAAAAPAVTSNTTVPAAVQQRYSHTYLDSHYYQVFATNPRGLSPRQHIAFVCQNEYKDVLNCCYRDAKQKQQPNTRAQDGVRRLVGEWSAATDKLPVAILRKVMDGIAATGIAPQLDRSLSPGRQAFLKHYMQAQMVAYEAVGSNSNPTDTATAGLSAGWFYWTAKMEGGAFAEWDYLRAVREGWMPALPRSDQPSQDLYGTCYDIIFNTDDDMSVIHEFPDPDTIPVNWWEDPIDDDVVVSHGDSLMNVNGHYIQPVRHHTARGQRILSVAYVLLGVVLACLALWRTRRFWMRLLRRVTTYNDKMSHHYEPVGEARIASIGTDMEDDSSSLSSGVEVGSTIRC